MSDWLDTFERPAQRVNRFLERPRVERFVDAFSVYYIVVAGVFVVAVLVALAVAAIVGFA